MMGKQRLFFKIFFWFWLAMALVWAGFLIPAQLNQDQAVFRGFQALHGQRLLMSGRTALYVSRRGGEDSVHGWMESFEEDETPYPFVIDESLRDVGGREVPEPAVEAARLTLEHDTLWDAVSGDPEGRIWAGRRMEDVDGKLFAVVQRLPSSSNPPPSPWWAVTRWLAVLLTSGLVCYWLARYLIAPLSTLSVATRQFASGDLDVRVGEHLGGRSDELGDLGRDFDGMAERIGLLLRNQRQLLSDISHELRSPLARLYVALGLARKRGAGQADEALDRIERETERLNELIGQLLSLTRLESEGFPAQPEPVELLDLVTEIVDDADYEARGRERGVLLAHGDSCTALGFEELLRRAIENVIRNAVRYTSQGTEVETTLRLQAANGTSTAVIRVRDHGPGVPSERLSDLFRPFYRLDDARDRESGGTGLGLAISDRAVRLHGGKINASNAEEGGLVVEIELPVRPTEA